MTASSFGEIVGPNSGRRLGEGFVGGGGGLEMEIGSIVAGYSLDKNLLFRLVYFYWHSVRKCQLLSRESDRGAGPLSHFVPLRYR